MTILDNVYTLPEIVEGLEKISNKMTNFSAQKTEDVFQAPYGEKWSMAGNLEHLILSNGAMAKTFSYPKEKLAERFGTSKRPSFKGPEIIEKYLGQLQKLQIKAPPAYSPNPENPKSKDELLKMWTGVEMAFQNNLKNWTDADLDIYQIPHPAMGNLTLRELASFAIYHTEHHLKAMEKIAAATE